MSLAAERSEPHVRKRQRVWTTCVVPGGQQQEQHNQLGQEVAACPAVAACPPMVAACPPMVAACPPLAATAQGQQEKKQLDEHEEKQEEARLCWPQAHWLARESKAGMPLADFQSRYKLGVEISSGAFGHVYTASGPQGDVAVKIVQMVIIIMIRFAICMAIIMIIRVLLIQIITLIITTVIIVAIIVVNTMITIVFTFMASLMLLLGLKVVLRMRVSTTTTGGGSGGGARFG